MTLEVYSMNECMHEWVYEQKILCSDPPKQNRICKFCGKKEMVTLFGIQTLKGSEYEELVEKFKNE